MNKLEQFIMGMDAEEITEADVLYPFWHDREVLEEKETELTIAIEINKDARRKVRKRKDREARQQLAAECDNLFMERKRIRAKLERQKEAIHIAFNQLFLAGKVKEVPYPRHGIFWTQADEDEYNKPKTITETINECAHIEGYKGAEILKRSEMPAFMKQIYKPKGELICVGSLLAMEVWPSTILKDRNGN